MTSTRRELSGGRVSNPRPAPWQGAALPTEPPPHRPETPDAQSIGSARRGRHSDVRTRLGDCLRNTTARGDLAELAVATALVRAGKRLLRPVSSATRYDLVIDNDDGSFTRIQCKTGVFRHGRIEFRLYSVSGHRPRAVSYRGQVDAFGVYCPDTKEAYLVPVAALGACDSMASIRVLPPKNGQVTRLRLARDYLIEGGP